MAKNCSYCGKQLTFRDSFEWDKKPVCRSCLANLEQGQKSNSEPMKQRLSAEVYPTNTTYIGNTGSYLLLLFGGLAICLIGGIIGIGGEPAGFVLLIPGIIALIAAEIYFLVLFYQVWRFVISESQRSGLVPSIETPGKAIGYCFIPFYNFYWFFKAFGKFPKDFNLLAKAKGSNNIIEEGLGTTIPVLLLISIIPYLGSVVSLIILFILYPMFISQAVRFCKEISERGHGPESS